MEYKKRLARIEAKINTIARAVIWLLSVVAGFVVYSLTENEALAPYYGFGVAIAVGGLIEWRMRQIEQILPHDDE